MLFNHIFCKSLNFYVGQSTNSLIISTNREHKKYNWVAQPEPRSPHGLIFVAKRPLQALPLLIFLTSGQLYNDELSWQGRGDKILKLTDSYISAESKEGNPQFLFWPTKQGQNMDMVVV